MMTIRNQLISSPETISDLELAAEDRYTDGEMLLRSGRPDGAVYLLGLAAEMWLKVACFRASGHGPATPVPSLLAPAQKWMKYQAPDVPSESYHNLRFWSEYLILLRRESTYPLPRHLIGELRHHVVRRMFGDWKIDMRYRRLPLDAQAARRVYQDVSWLRVSRTRLWS